VTVTSNEHLNQRNKQTKMTTQDKNAQVPVARLTGLDEYGPQLEWFGHWTDFATGSVFYSVPGKHAEEVAPNALLLTPRIYGGFRGAFYVAKNRQPTEQEIFDAGVRSGLARAEEAKPRQAIERIKAFLDAYDATDMGDGILGVILEGDTTVDLLASDLRKILGLAEAPRKNETCKPGGCSAIGCEGGHYCFRPDGTPIVVTPEKRQELERALAGIFNIAFPGTAGSSASTEEVDSKAPSLTFVANRRQFNPPHPGETLREDIIPAKGMTVAAVASALGLAESDLQAVLDGKARITAELANRIELWLGAETGGRAEVWLALQADHDLWQLRSVKGGAA
jgi:antitoxin HigA-1